MIVEMRRALSILLVIFFSLGPLTTTLQADDDSRLPACCRRHGEHHCAMAGQMAPMLASSGATPIVAAPAHCPYFPGYLAQSMAPITALTPTPAALPAPRVQPLADSPIRTSARFRPVRAHLSRGPPESISC